MKLYNIAGQFIAGQELPDNFQPFETKEEVLPQCIILKSYEGLKSLAEESYQYEHREFVVQQRSDEGWQYSSTPHLPPVQVHTTANYRHITYFLPAFPDQVRQKEQLTNLLRVILECYFITKGILSLHSACVELHGCAVAFSGKSGIGKSTRAQTWEEHLQATWISGDRPAMKIQKDTVIACGVPWDGKEQIFRPGEHPLRAILEVRRAGFQGLRRLNSAQAKSFLVKQCFIPMWDTELAAQTLGDIQRLSQIQLTYRVFGGPDETSARALAESLFNDSAQIGEEQQDMKIRDGFKLSKAVGEYMILPVGDMMKRFEGAVVLNEVSAYVYQQLEKGISKQDLLSCILAEFQVESSVAETDLDALLETFQIYGLLEEEEIL